MSLARQPAEFATTKLDACRFDHVLRRKIPATSAGRAPGLQPDDVGAMHRRLQNFQSLQKPASVGQAFRRAAGVHLAGRLFSWTPAFLGTL